MSNKTETTSCVECGMPVSGQYHPYAACLMFKSCKNSETVEINLKAVLNEGEQLAYIKRNARF